ncbi:MAG: multidrug effflux MFS transporter [Mycobacteriaceae bacterium]|uniref:multidrug effflux MFS transporter n=1 Tax=Corynebacterium sp. TaxID=1720 RepID=UPI003F9C9E0A
MPIALLLTLGLLAAVAPFATDLYLPAMPQIADDLSTSASGAQLSLTAFLIGTAVGQLLFGPWSDKAGRRLPLVIGSVVYLLASAATALAPSIAVLVALRLVQGLAGAAGMVIGRAIISDRYRGPAAAQAMSLMMIVGGVAPVIAPFVGSTLADPLGWRGLLWIVAALGLIALVCVLAIVPETHPRSGEASSDTSAEAEADTVAEKETRDGASGTARSGLRNLLSRDYLSNTLAFSFGFATMMAYISASPFLYQKYMGLGTLQYGLAFAANALVLMVVSIPSAKLTARFRVRSLARTGLGLNLLGVLLYGILHLAGAPAISLMFPLVIVVGSLGLVLGNTTALALDAVPGAAGSASAVLGFLQFGLAGVVAPLVGLGGELDPLPLAVTMLVASLVANVAITASPGEPSEGHRRREVVSA